VRRALAALLLCGACGGGLPMDPCTGIGVGGTGGFGGQGGTGTDGGGIGGGGGFSGSFTAMLTGTEQSIQLTVQPAQVCNEGKTPATRVTTKVFGPDNLPVDHTNNGASNGTSEFDPYVTTITFTPTQPGDYHFVAQFEPNLGIAQLDLIAALDFTQLPEAARFPGALVNLNCSRPGVTSFGTLICGNNAQMPHTFRDGGTVGDIMAETFAVQGNTVWTAWSDDLVTRYVDTGSGPLVAMDTFTLSTPVFTLVPISEDAVLAVTSSGAERWMRIDGGFMQEHVWTLNPAGIGVQGAVIDGDNILVATSTQLFESSDGGTALDPGPVLALMLGFGPDGVWALKSDDFSLGLYRPGGGPARTLNLGLAWQDATPPTWDVRPWTQQADFYVAYYDPAQDELFLSDYGNPSLISAGRDWIVLVEPGGDVVVKKAPAP
jgi:hypothetical protein